MVVEILWVQQMTMKTVLKYVRDKVVYVVDVLWQEPADWWKVAIDYAKAMFINGKLIFNSQN